MFSGLRGHAVLKRGRVWGRLRGMGSIGHTAALAALVMGLSACAIAPPRSAWTLFDTAGSETGAEYADFLAARYAGMTDDPASAARFYRRAFERAPTDGAILEKAAFATLVEGDVGAVVRLASAADPKALAAAPFAQLALIADDIAQARNTKALKRIESGQLGILNEDVARGLSAWLLAAGNTDKGLAKLDPALQISSSRGAIYSGMQGLILSSAKRDAAALEKFRAGQQLRSGDLLSAAHIRLAAAGGDLSRAKTLFDSNYFPMLRLKPEMLRVSAMMEGVEPAAALRPSTREGAATAVYLLAPPAGLRANPELASTYLALALHIDPELEGARADLAEALMNEGRREAAIEVLHGFRPASPYYGKAKIDEASLLQGLGRHDQALAVTKAALGASRQRQVLLAAADLYRAESKLTDAEALYGEVVKADVAANFPDWRPIFARATVREKLGRWSDAETDLRAAMKLAPDQPEVLNFLGYAWIDRGENVEEGFRLIQQAIQARPDQGYIVDSLGWAHFRRGDYEEAVVSLEKATELTPSDAVITDHLGDAYWRAGRRLEAEFEWKRALTLAPEPAQAAELKRKLSNGLPELAQRAPDPGQVRR